MKPSFFGISFFLVGLVMILFNKELAGKNADYEKFFSKMPEKKLIKHYRIGLYIIGTTFTIVGILRLLDIV